MNMMPRAYRNRKVVEERLEKIDAHKKHLQELKEAEEARKSEKCAVCESKENIHIVDIARSIALCAQHFAALDTFVTNMIEAPDA